jgi:UDP-GlcNAc:undecaprenyl-phosphate GlcNAc-1-phosphate transferase
MHLIDSTIPLLAQAPEGPVLRFSLDEVLSPYIWVVYAAFALTLLTTPIMRVLALRNGIVDWPDMKRKAHVEPVAYLGGVAVFLGWLAGVVTSFFITPHTAGLGSATINFPVSILVGAVIITLVGLFDDVYGISPRVKLGGQLIAAALLAGETVGTRLAAGVIELIATIFNFDAQMLPGFEFVAYWLGAALVMLLVLGGCNAANLLDGLDGLASGVTAIVAAGFTVISVSLAMGLYGAGGAYSAGVHTTAALDPVRIVVCLALLGAVLGFLPYNFNPAMIFMGDTGSMLLGFLCTSTILLFAEKGDLTPVIAALFVFALPIIDTSMAIVRRKVRGQPIFSPDNQHLHHQLVRSGMTVKQAVSSLYIMALAFGALGCSLVFIRLRYVAVVFLVVCAFVVVTAYKVGHRQFVAMQLKKQTPAPPQTPEPVTDSQASPDPPADQAPRQS